MQPDPKPTPDLEQHLFLYFCILLRLPTCAEKPVLIAVTLRRLPHELQVTKYRRFSPLLRSVSCDRQVLQATYSTVWR